MGLATSKLPKKLPIINSCFGVIFEEGQFPLRVYLVHNSPDPLGPNGELGKPEGCGLPGGGGKLGETPFEAAFREIKDEAGIITKVAARGGKDSQDGEILYEEKYVIDVDAGKPALNKIYIFHLLRTNSKFEKITETSETGRLILATLGSILTMPLARKFAKNADGNIVGTVENPEGIYFSARERIFGVAKYLGYDFYDLIPNLDDLFPKIREEEVGWYIHGLLSEAVEKKEKERERRARLLRVPDEELVEKYAAWAGGAPNELEKRYEEKVERGQKFVMVRGHQELHITACAVVKNSDPAFLESFNGSKNYFAEPNAKWRENPADEWAWIKIYHYLYPEKNPDSEKDQVIRIPMKFFGKSPDDCYGEVPFTIKYKKGDRILRGVELGRNKSYDSRLGKWVAETQPIIPKNDQGSHGYVALRLYHENYLPAGQPDWRFGPVYAVIGGENFYRIETEWFKEEIVITISSIPGDSPEIPKHIIGFRELSSVVRKLKK